MSRNLEVPPVNMEDIELQATVASVLQLLVATYPGIQLLVATVPGTTPLIVTDPPLSTEHCDWLYGIFGHETSCTRYWTCWNGTATEQLCIGGLLYNEVTHSCDWPENVEGCQKHPLCNEDANGNVPLGKSCNRYWQCQGGYPRLQRCPAQLVFDRRSLRCVVPPTEDCEVLTTQAPPLDEDEEGEQNIPQRGRGGGEEAPNLPLGAVPLPVKSRSRN
uniref:Chitin-binding type-2 domain-containing protein n=1 Tax=Timema monikensis TaxID=170555 RepID=A0A7R9HT12_9NEOP|nr:unnamed protein product [Timema monikensis]